jgi:hypothetical protein
VTVTGAGETEISALLDLHGRLTGMPRPADDAAKRAAINRRLRQAFYQGAEEEASRSGHGLDEPRLERILRWYPGDV